MKVNVVEFKNVIKKASLNYLIDNIKLNVTRDTISVASIAQLNEGIVIINKPNNIITDLKDNDDIDLFFSSPQTNLLPYIDLFDDAEVNAKVDDDSNNRIIFFNDHQKTTVHFCSPKVVKLFPKETDNFHDNMNHVGDFEFTEDVHKDFNKISKVGTQLNKVYFDFTGDALIVVVTDKSNTFSNSLKFKISNFVLDKDFKEKVSICLEKSVFMKLMSVISVEEKFKVSVHFNKDKRFGGLIKAFNDGETYYLIQRLERS